jgi:hypothetical protein
MKWFNRLSKKKLEMLQAIRPSSKATLKIQCLMLCNGKVDEAEKLYDYFAKDMPDLPDYDAPVPTWFDNTKDVASGIVSWLGQNKDTLAQGYEILRGITGNRLPPLMGGIDVPPEAPAAPIPPINE